MNILTFDIEEWFTYTQYPKGGELFFKPMINQLLEELLNKLDEHNVKATFFCLGVIARDNPEVIKKIYKRGHEIGCHSDTHKFITNLTPKSFKEDTHNAIDSLEQLIGKKVEYYRAPAFSITESTKWALEILLEEGIKYDSSIFPSNRNFGGFKSFNESNPVILKINGLEIKEFPMNYANIMGKRIIYSGGGYFRLLPYSMIKGLMKKSDYNMTYFHIKDFDSKQKKIHPFFSIQHLYSYYGINTSFKKFNNLISDFHFISMGQSIEKIDWSKKLKLTL